MTLCECGCGREVKSGNRFVHGHNGRGKQLSDDHKLAISIKNSGSGNGMYGKVLSDADKLKKSIGVKKAHKNDPSIGRRMAISRTGDKNPAWLGGISFGEYCPKFNNQIKQYIRDKYNYCDYISGIPSYICNPHRELDVHHVDYERRQGCEDHEWRLIPLSQINHVRTNFNRSFWNRLFTYSLEYDEIYYNDKQINIMEMI